MVMVRTSKSSLSIMLIVSKISLVFKTVSLSEKKNFLFFVFEPHLDVFTPIVFLNFVGCLSHFLRRQFNGDFLSVDDSGNFHILFLSARLMVESPNQIFI